MKTVHLTTAACLVLFVFISTCIAVTPDAFNSIVDLIQNGQYNSAFEKIKQIKKADPSDPEYFVLAINYYFIKCQNNYINLKSGIPTKDSVLVLSDTATGEPIGYIDDTTIFNSDTLQIGISILKEGLKLYPYRLDMHIGLITVTESSGMYDKMTDAILTILKNSDPNRGQVDLVIF